MWLYIVQGIGYGLAAAAQPGPFQTYLVSQTLISDGPIIALCLLVLSQVPLWFQRFLYIAGGLFLLYLAYGAYKAWKTFELSIPDLETGTQQSVLKAALINILNPNPYIFWSLVTGPILVTGWHQTPAYGLGFLISFYITLILGFSMVVIVFGPARQLGPKVNRALLAISAIALFCFGLIQLWLGIKN